MNPLCRNPGSAHESTQPDLQVYNSSEETDTVFYRDDPFLCEHFGFAIIGNEVKGMSVENSLSVCQMAFSLC